MANDAKFTWVRGIFRRRSFAEDAVEAAVVEQLRFEASHPVAFAPDQRRLALLQRCDRIARAASAPPFNFEPLVDQAMIKIDEKLSQKATKSAEK